MNISLPRRDIIILSIYLLVIGGLCAGGIILWGSYDEAQTRYEQIDSERITKEKQFENIAELRARLAELQELERHYQPYFTRNKQEQAVLEILTREVTNAGLVFDSISTQGGGGSPRLREAGGAISDEFSVDINVQGTLSQVSTLLRSIEQKYPPIRVVRLGTNTLAPGKLALTMPNATDSASFQINFSSFFKQTP